MELHISRPNPSIGYYTAYLMFFGDFTDAKILSNVLYQGLDLFVIKAVDLYNT